MPDTKKPNPDYAGKPPSTKRLRAMQCDLEAPATNSKGEPVDKRRCNRPAGHDGPHRVIDARTFRTKCEWFAGVWLAEPGPAK